LNVNRSKLAVGGLPENGGLPWFLLTIC